MARTPTMFPFKAAAPDAYQFDTIATVSSGSVTAQAPTAAQSYIDVAVSTNTVTVTFPVATKFLGASCTIIKAAGTLDAQPSMQITAYTTSSVTFQCHKSSDGSALSVPDCDLAVSVRAQYGKV